MNIAARTEYYSVPNYAGYVPTQVLDATQYINYFYQKHKGTVLNLEKNMIAVWYSVFKCNLDLLEDDHVEEHSREVHGLEDDIISLSPFK